MFAHQSSHMLEPSSLQSSHVKKSPPACAGFICLDRLKSAPLPGQPSLSRPARGPCHTVGSMRHGGQPVRRCTANAGGQSERKQPELTCLRDGQAAWLFWATNLTPSSSATSCNSSQIDATSAPWSCTRKSISCATCSALASVGTLTAK